MPTPKDQNKKKKARRAKPGREDGKVLSQEDIEIEVGNADDMFDPVAPAKIRADARAAFRGLDLDGEAKTESDDEEDSDESSEPTFEYVKVPETRREKKLREAAADEEADAQAAFGFESTDSADENPEEPVFENDSDDEADEGDRSANNGSKKDRKNSDKKVHIEFPYSEMIRARAPKVFDVAETVATDWVNDGNFENVPVGHPVAQMTVAAGLRKAKEVEKKLEEKGVFMMAKMGLDFAKSKLKR